MPHEGSRCEAHRLERPRHEEGREMRNVRWVIALTLLLITPGAALAQTAPTVYVCTPDGQIVRANDRTVILSGGGAFDDCVLGPDGRLYISEVVTGSSPNRIVRVDPDSASPTRETIATTLPSAP